MLTRCYVAVLCILQYLKPDFVVWYIISHPLHITLLGDYVLCVIGYDSNLRYDCTCVTFSFDFQESACIFPHVEMRSKQSNMVKTDQESLSDEGSGTIKFAGVKRAWTRALPRRSQAPYLRATPACSYGTCFSRRGSWRGPCIDTRRFFFFGSSLHWCKPARGCLSRCLCYLRQ